MKNVYLVLLVTIAFTVGAPTNCQAQTIVNKAWQDTTGHPIVTLPYQALTKDAAGNVLIGGSTYTTGAGVATLLAKYTSAGALLWEVLSTDTIAAAYVTIDIHTWGNDVYLTGMKYDSITSKSTMFLFKYSSTGTFLWSKTYSGSNIGYDIPAAVNIDDSGYVYIAGTDQKSSTESQMVVIKYDSAGNQKWVTTYDTTNMFTSGTAMALTHTGTTVVVGGFSGTGFGSWSFITLSVNRVTGVAPKPTWASNGNGSLSSPAGVGQDYSGRDYIAGTATSSGSNTDIKVIAYDTSFNERWLHIWGNSDSLADSASRMAMDGVNDILITGYTTASNGTKQMLTLKYNPGGTLLWARTISALNPTYNCSGKDITTDANNNVYVTGYEFNGSDYDFITVAYGPNGNTLWEKTYDGGGTNDNANNIVVDSLGDVYVSGTSISATTSTFVTIEYQQLTVAPTVVPTASNIPRHASNQVIVHFPPSSILNSSFFAKTDLQFGTLGSIIDSPLVNQMDSAYGAGGTMKTWILQKIFTGLVAADTLSRTRSGDTIHVPSFYSVLILNTQKTKTGGNSEIAVMDSLKKLKTALCYSQLNYVGRLDATPNDTFYSAGQTSLHYNSTVTNSEKPGEIRADSAWSICTGKSFIKVGVFDSGLDFTNPDFGYQSPYMTNRVKDDWDVEANVDGFTQTGALPDSDGHGTACAGIIGAVTNDSIGVSGIAGGWYNQSDSASNNANGVSLYGAKLFYDIYGEDTLAFLSNTANAITTTSLAPGTASYTWGLQIMNNSWGIDSVETPNFFYSSNEYLLRDAVHFVNRQQVTFIASRGNDAGIGVYNFTHLPASYDSAWVISVGGADQTGNYTGASLYGGNLTLVAPEYPGNITTTNMYDPNMPYSRYISFGGTSAAAAHVSGVAALLKSYADSSVDAYKNLAPEDVKYLLEKSASDRGAAGYDSLNGYGFLLADSALLLIHKPHYYIKHFGNSHGVSSTWKATLINADTTLQFNESTQASNGYNIAPFTNYKCNVFKDSVHVLHTISGSEVIEQAWVRHSSSNTANLFASGMIWPHERVQLTNYTSSYANLQNYVYQLLDSVGHSLGWYPSDTSSANTKMEYSVLIYNATATDIERVEDEAMSILVFPNPSHSAQTIEINLSEGENISIELYDMQGRAIKEVYSGVCETGRNDIHSDISNLASGIYFYRIKGQSFMHTVKFDKM